MSRDRPIALIVDRDPDLRDRVGGWLEDEGLDVVACPGPTAPEYTCIGSMDGHCPLAQEADLVVLEGEIAYAYVTNRQGPNVIVDARDIALRDALSSVVP